MKKATIDNLIQGDQFAEPSASGWSAITAFEVLVATGAAQGERVHLPQLGAERTVFASRFDSRWRVVRFSQKDWLVLRGAFPNATDEDRRIAADITPK